MPSPDQFAPRSNNPPRPVGDFGPGEVSQEERVAAGYLPRGYFETEIDSATQERLRFLREQLRRGRLSTLLGSGSTSERGGLGQRTLLGN